MAAIIFTDREMQRAWRENFKASKSNPRTNAHRLLLFYSIECGLKAILMKRRSATCTDACPEIVEAQHNINRLLDCLSAGQSLKLPDTLHLRPIKIQGTQTDRNLDPGRINQVWRYGGQIQRGNHSSATNDDSIEQQLSNIAAWIQRELE